MKNFSSFPSEMVRLVCCTLLLGWLVVGPVMAQLATVNETRWMAGDSRDWAMPRFDDSAWNEIADFKAAPKSPFWIRERITIDRTHPINQEHILSIEGAGAFQIFFDGQLLGGSGKVAVDGEAEKAGASQFALGVPPEFLATGDHIIAFRISALNLQNPDDFFVEYRLEPARKVTLENSLSMLALGGAVAAAIILLVFFAVGSFGSSQKNAFYAAIGIAFGVVVIILMEALNRAGVIAYPWRSWTDMVAMIAALTVFASLPLFLILRFRSPKPIFWGLGIIAVFLASLLDWPAVGYEHDARAFVLLCLFSMGICWVAFRSGHQQARIFMLGLGALAAGIIFDPRSLYTFLVLLSVFLSISFADYLRQQQLLAKQAEVTSARLEAEMLRRNIQPHFLMNSLTAVTEWIETAPVEALRFIDGLAEEFRSLTVLSSQKSAALSDEIELCRVHLDLMGMRQRKKFHFDVEGVDLSAEIPPGVIHTLLENAISHNRYQEKEITFTLREERNQSGRTLSLTTPIGKKTNHNLNSTGSGLQYVRSRLEESFPGKWRFSSKPENGAWVSRIFISNT